MDSFNIITIILSIFYSWLVFLRLLYSLIQDGFNVFKVKPIDIPPFILNDSSLGKHGFIKLKKQGIQLHYVEKGDRTKPLMLLLHGFPQCWLSWRHQLKEFSANYWVIALDMRGYGESDKPKGKANYDSDILVEDIKEFVIELGKPKTILIAHDWGSLIAWGAVEKYPELFTKHINLNGSHLAAFKQLVSTNFKQFRMSWYVFFFQCPILPEIMLRLKNLELYAQMLRGDKNLVQAFPDDVIEGYKYYYSKKGAFTAPLNYYRNIPKAKTSFSKKIQVPSLIIWGTEDTALSRELPVRNQRMCEDCQIEYIRDTGHFVQEENPKAVNEAIWRFLK